MGSRYGVLPVFVNLPLLPSCTIFNQIKYSIELMWLYMPKAFGKKTFFHGSSSKRRKGRELDLKIQSGIHTKIEIKIARRK